MTAPVDTKRRVDLAAGLLDADDVATMLKVKRSTVQNLARRLHDPIPSVKVGRARRFSVPEIEAWVARQ
jgi:excisionase family DNA binding protein